MKNAKRMMAVIAASGLVLGAMPGIANAQSAELGLNLGGGLGSSGAGAGGGLDLGAALGSTAPATPASGSLADFGSAAEGETGGDVATGSLGSITGSLDPEEGDDFDFAGSLEGLFDFESGSAGSADETTPVDPPATPAPGAGGSVADLNLDTETLLALGSLAGAGIAIGIAVNGGIELPALPTL
ncbi:hypothetical protein [Dietzia lutea]|uniref:hypothetical protein n=1 Tax=Dietzia lutea TaxID=546160 RepID=UPI00132F6EEA|nr:hypothetical protein [Dietzia lutea]